MKTITVKCDYCQNIINQVDVVTGVKYLNDYKHIEINVSGDRAEFCSKICMENHLHTGEPGYPSQPIAPMTAESETPLPTWESGVSEKVIE